MRISIRNYADLWNVLLKGKNKKNKKKNENENRTRKDVNTNGCKLPSVALFNPSYTSMNILVSVCCFNVTINKKFVDAYVTSDMHEQRLLFFFIFVIFNCRLNPC